MKIEVLRETKNPLLGRRELTLLVSDYAATPNKKELAAEAAARLGGKDENIVIETLRQAYGKNEAHALIKIYDSPESLKKAEPKKKEKKTAEGEKPEEKK